MKIYTYGQQCILAGRVWVGNDDDDPEENGDLDMWGEGTEEELIAEARRELRLYDGGHTIDLFPARRARNVLEFLGADEGDDDCEEEDED